MNALLVTAVLFLCLTNVSLLVWILRLRRDERERSDARVAALAATLTSDAPAHPVENVFAEGSLFSDARVESPAPSSRTPAIAAAAVGMAIVLVAALVAGTSRVSGTVSPNPPMPDPLLALIDLDHRLNANALVVSGTVRERSDSHTTVESLEAIVAVFDGAGRPRGEFRSETKRLTQDDGRVLASEATGARLHTFSTIIANASGIARYRVSFRRADRVLPHVDRRTAAAAPGSPQ